MLSQLLTHTEEEEEDEEFAQNRIHARGAIPIETGPARCQEKQDGEYEQEEKEEERKEEALTYVQNHTRAGTKCNLMNLRASIGWFCASRARVCHCPDRLHILIRLSVVRCFVEATLEHSRAAVIRGSI